MNEQQFRDRFEKRATATDGVIGKPWNIWFGLYRYIRERNGEEAAANYVDEGLKDLELRQLQFYIKGASVEDAWADMIKKNMDVREYIEDYLEGRRKRNVLTSFRIENGNTLYATNANGEEMKVRFRPFNVEDSGDKFKRYTWEDDEGNEYELMVYGDNQESLSYSVNDTERFLLHATPAQFNALREALDPYVVGELEGGRRRRRKQRRKTRRTKASRRRQTRARRVRN